MYRARLHQYLTLIVFACCFARKIVGMGGAGSRPSCCRIAGHFA